MLIGSRQKLTNLPSLPSLNINKDPIKHSHCFKSLGVLVDENPTWENHVDAISRKIASGSGAVKRINHCLPCLPPCTLSIIPLSNHILTIAAWYRVAVVKFYAINGSGFRTVRCPFLQTPIMMSMEACF